MEIRNFYNVLEGFDYNLLDNPEFKEDSVREEIILPIIKGLGYDVSKPFQIIRSRKLLHPFVSIGCQKKNIYIIPDYLFEVNDKPAWILDAKSPSENILKSHHVEQAYSYAIHSEVRADFFALCNGREFVLYSIHKIEPILHFPIQSIPTYWDNLRKFLAPENIFSKDHFKLAKDLGLHLKRLGFDKVDNLIFPDVPVLELCQLDQDMFTFSAGLIEEGDNYIVTFDFNFKVLSQLKGKIPEEAIHKLSARNSNYRQAVRFGDKAFIIGVNCNIGNNLQENEDEIFLPLIINSILP